MTLIRLNNGESVTIYSRESETLLTVMSNGDTIGWRELNKNTSMDIETVKNLRSEDNCGYV